MKVVLTSHIYAAQYNHVKLRHLAQQVALIVAAPSHWHTALFPHQSAQTAGDYHFVRLPTWFAGRNNAFVYRANLTRLLRRWQPDLLHIEQEPVSLVTQQWLAAARRAHVPATLFTWENLPAATHLRGRRRWYARSLRRLSGLLAGNHVAAQMAAEHVHGPIAQCPMMGIDPHPQVTPAPRPNAAFMVGYAGRLVPEKGLDTLLAATAPLPDTHTCFIGDGPLAPMLRQHPNVTVTGAIQPGHMPAHLALLDVLVLPSRTTPHWQEQFGKVLIEAMAVGVPVAGSDSGAIPETIAAAGLLFAEGDAEALRAVLLRLRDDSGLRAELAERGRQRAAQFSHAIIAQKTVAFWRQVLELPQGRSII